MMFDMGEAWPPPYTQPVVEKPEVRLREAPPNDIVTAMQPGRGILQMLRDQLLSRSGTWPNNCLAKRPPCKRHIAPGQSFQVSVTLASTHRIRFAPAMRHTSKQMTNHKYT